MLVFASKRLPSKGWATITASLDGSTDARGVPFSPSRRLLSSRDEQATASIIALEPRGSPAPQDAKRHVPPTSPNRLSKNGHPRIVDPRARGDRSRAGSRMPSLHLAGASRALESGSVDALPVLRSRIELRCPCRVASNRAGFGSARRRSVQETPALIGTTEPELRTLASRPFGGTTSRAGVFGLRRDRSSEPLTPPVARALSFRSSPGREPRFLRRVNDVGPSCSKRLSSTSAISRSSLFAATLGDFARHLRRSTFVATLSASALACLRRSAHANHRSASDAPLLRSVATRSASGAGGWSVLVDLPAIDFRSASIERRIHEPRRDDPSLFLEGERRPSRLSAPEGHDESRLRFGAEPPLPRQGREGVRRRRNPAERSIPAPRSHATSRPKTPLPRSRHRRAPLVAEHEDGERVERPHLVGADLEATSPRRNNPTWLGASDVLVPRTPRSTPASRSPGLPRQLERGGLRISEPNLAREGATRFRNPRCFSSRGPLAGRPVFHSLSPNCG